MSEPTTTTSSTSTSKPTSEYRVQLDAYAGPLDLLLYLVKRHEIDLNDVPMAELTEQYLSHLKVIESLPGAQGGIVDVDRAGEFLVMAATLVEIKSQMLLPLIKSAEDEEGEDGENPNADPTVDPRFELVQQLLAYKKFKDASLSLAERRGEWEQRFPAVAKPAKKPQALPTDEDDETATPPIELDLEDVNIMDLCSAFGRMLDSIGFTGDHEVTYDDTPISLHADDIADRLRRDAGEKGMTLRELFIGRKSRSEMIGLFLATLELVRQRRVRVAQDPDGGEICLHLRPDSESTAELDAAEEAPADWTNPETGQIEYDWPNAQEKKRADRRARLRATIAAKRESEQASADKDGDGAPDPDQPEEADDDPDFDDESFDEDDADLDD